MASGPFVGASAVKEGVTRGHHRIEWPISHYGPRYSGNERGQEFFRPPHMPHTFFEESAFSGVLEMIYILSQLASVAPYSTFRGQMPSITKELNLMPILISLEPKREIRNVFLVSTAPTPGSIWTVNPQTNPGRGAVGLYEIGTVG